MSEEANCKEEEQVQTEAPPHQRVRGKYNDGIFNIRISRDELYRARLNVKEIKNYFLHHNTQETPEQVDKLMKLIENIHNRSNLRDPFDYSYEITHKSTDGDPMVNLTDGLKEINGLFSPITILNFNSSIGHDVADKLCKEIDYKTQLNCLILSDDSQQQINDSIKQIQSVFNFNNTQIIEIRGRINQYYTCRKLYKADGVKELTNDVIIFTIIDSAINTTNEYAKHTDLNTWKSVHYLIRYMKECSDLEMCLFKYGRTNIPQTISENVCEQYKLDASNIRYKKIMKAIMTTWIRNNMSFISQPINNSFKKVFISDKMIKKCMNFINMNENDNELFRKDLWAKSHRLGLYKTYKTNAGFENLNLTVFWTDMYNDENERIFVVAIKHDTFDESLGVIDFIFDEQDASENAQYGIKPHELPENTNGKYKWKYKLYIEPSTNNSSLKAAAKTYIHTSKAMEKMKKMKKMKKTKKMKKMSIIDEENEEILNQGEHIVKKSKPMKYIFIKTEKNEKAGDSDNINDAHKGNSIGVTMEKDEQIQNLDTIKGKNVPLKENNKIKGTFKYKPNKINKVNENDNDEKKQCEEFKVELISEVLCDAWLMTMEQKWTEMIVNKSVICESFPKKEIFFYDLKYTMLIQQINGYYTVFKYNHKKYVIFNTELTHSKNKRIMYIIGVKVDNGWQKAEFMNANEITNKYRIKQNNLPIGTRLNSKIFKGIHSFEYSLINNISCAMYANISCIKTSQKKKQIKNVVDITLTKLCELIKNAIHNKHEMLPIISFDKKKQKYFIDIALPIQLDNKNWCFIIYRNCKPIKIGIDCTDIKIKSKLYNPKSNVFKKHKHIQNNITRLHILNDQRSKRLKQNGVKSPSTHKKKKTYQGIITKYNRQYGYILCDEFEQPLSFLKSTFKSSDYNKIKENVAVEFEVEIGSVPPRVDKAMII